MPEKKKKTKTGKNNAFGRFLRKTRKSLAYSQDELGAKTVMSGAAICRYENGQRRPDQEIVTRLAGALNCSAQKMFLLLMD